MWQNVKIPIIILNTGPSIEYQNDGHNKEFN